MDICLKFLLENSFWKKFHDVKGGVAKALQGRRDWG